MNILLCNERFLFRFGLDRALILLGRGLKARGHRITVMANHYDAAVLNEFANRCIDIPQAGDAYMNLNEFTAIWIQGHWHELFNSTDKPDVAIIGGWPFFATIPIFEQLGVRTIFMDCGAVPLGGLDDGARQIQTKLRALRRAHLNQASLITPISVFIGESQSRPDAGDVRVVPILLGADHMDRPIWKARQITHHYGSPPTEHRVRDLKARGYKLILNLGRWEPGCYKNSEALYQLASTISSTLGQCAFVVLADEATLNIPAPLRHLIYPIGCPDDSALSSVMDSVDLGVSISTWEGFNLPLVEMQWLDKPVLAFDVGAHREVIVDSWYLCDDIHDMGAKVVEILQGRSQDSASRFQTSQHFHEAFRWEDVVTRYDAELRNLVAAIPPAPLTILVDVSNATRDPANSGVMRVTRRVCRELQCLCRTIFVVWDEDQLSYVLPTQTEYEQLSAYNGPVIKEDIPYSPIYQRLCVVDVLDPALDKNVWLLFTETLIESSACQRRALARSMGWHIAAIFHDSIPMMRPELCPDPILRANHPLYMQGLAYCDIILPNSVYSGQCLREFWDHQQIHGCNITPNLLPAEFAGASRPSTPRKLPTSKISILCISTLEPRKNHRNLIAAWQILQQEFASLDLSLILIGNRAAGADALAEFIRQSCRNTPSIRWLGIVDDDTLHQLYSDSAFTVYPSTLEGFGMPIFESLWHGRPCICHHDGVMAELATGGGCFTTDMNEPTALAAAIHELATNDQLYAELAHAAITRPLTKWSDYARDLCRILMDSSGSYSKNYQAEAFEGDFSDWREILYPGCLTTGWQMRDVERLALTAVLHRIRPSCAIEIGTARGGSLSLIAQYAKCVFSIDIDPSISDKLKVFENVSFLTGSSATVLPVLLTELTRADVTVDFALIDGDHSAAAVKQDVDLFLNYVPKTPLVLLVHDSFNPECRRGILDAQWNKAPHVHWLDVDFVPGCRIEHGGTTDGEMWGGFAMAVLLPKRREGELCVLASAGRAFESMRKISQLQLDVDNSFSGQ